MQLIGTEGLSKLYTQSFSLLHLKTLWRARWPAACACAAAPPPASPLWPRSAAPQNNQQSTLYLIVILLSCSVTEFELDGSPLRFVAWDVDFDGVNSILRRVTCCEESAPRHCCLPCLGAMMTTRRSSSVADRTSFSSKGRLMVMESRSK